MAGWCLVHWTPDREVWVRALAGSLLCFWLSCVFPAVPFSTWKNERATQKRHRSFWHEFSDYSYSYFVVRNQQQCIRLVGVVPNRWPSQAGIVKDVEVLCSRAQCGMNYFLIKRMVCQIMVCKALRSPWKKLALIFFLLVFKISL